MKKLLFSIGLSLFLASGLANAQWNNFSMPSWANNNYSGNNMMPWSSWSNNYPRPYYYQQPRNYYPQPSSNNMMMPWNFAQQPTYRQAPPQQNFSGMMPWGGMMQQQARQQPQAQGFMMPGMDQGIRSMMAPGKIMAEEATPGMYMKPTWR